MASTPRVTVHEEEDPLAPSTPRSPGPVVVPMAAVTPQPAAAPVPAPSPAAPPVALPPKPSPQALPPAVPIAAQPPPVVLPPPVAPSSAIPTPAAAPPAGWQVRTPSGYPTAGSTFPGSYTIPTYAGAAVVPPPQPPPMSAAVPPPSTFPTQYPGATYASYPGAPYPGATYGVPPQQYPTAPASAGPPPLPYPGVGYPPTGFPAPYPGYAGSAPPTTFPRSSFATPVVPAAAPDSFGVPGPSVPGSMPGMDAGPKEIRRTLDDYADAFLAGSGEAPHPIDIASIPSKGVEGLQQCFQGSLWQQIVQMTTADKEPDTDWPTYLAEKRYRVIALIHLQRYEEASRELRSLDESTEPTLVDLIPFSLRLITAQLLALQGHRNKALSQLLHLRDNLRRANKPPFCNMSTEDRCTARVRVMAGIVPLVLETGGHITAIQLCTEDLKELGELRPEGGPFQSHVAQGRRHSKARPAAAGGADPASDVPTTTDSPAATGAAEGRPEASVDGDSDADGDADMQDVEDVSLEPAAAAGTETRLVPPPVPPREASSAKVAEDVQSVHSESDADSVVDDAVTHAAVDEDLVSRLKFFVMSMMIRVLLHAGHVRAAEMLTDAAQVCLIVFHDAHTKALAHVHKSLVLVAKGKYEEASSVCTEGLAEITRLESTESLDSAGLGMLSGEAVVRILTNNLAVCALHTRNIKGAVTALEDLVRRNPPLYLRSVVLSNLCVLYEVSGTRQEATRHKRVLSTVATRFHLNHLAPNDFRLK